MTDDTTPFAALCRKLAAVLTAEEMQAWTDFCKRIEGRYDGSTFEKISFDEPAELSAWADRSRQEAPSNGYNVDKHC